MSTARRKKFSASPEARALSAAIGERVHLIRRKLNISQADMAERFGRANNSAVSRLECGTAGSIFLDMLDGLIELAEEAGYTAEWLLTGELISRAVGREELARRLGEIMKDELFGTTLGEVEPATELGRKAAAKLASHRQKKGAVG